MSAEDLRAAILRKEIRREMRSAGDDELSEVIEREALSRSPKSKSVPPPISWLIAIVKLAPPKKRHWPVLLLLLMVAGYGAHRLGWLP